jgi:hypothetical protein
VLRLLQAKEMERKKGNENLNAEKPPVPFETSGFFF